jgi:hypothetical protein
MKQPMFWLLVALLIVFTAYEISERPLRTDAAKDASD